MAVFTHLSDEEICEFFQRYNVGEVCLVEPISQGIENSNYFIDTITDSRRNRRVLTIFETLPAEELPYFLDLMHWVAGRGLPVPDPLEDQHGNTLQQLAGKPAVVFSCLSGRDVSRPTPAHCREAGRLLARLHEATADFPFARSHPRDLAWMKLEAGRLRDVMPADMYRTLSEEICAYEMTYEQLDVLPKVVVHGDLFRDNLLFSGEQATGVIDFYHACTEIRLFDLAVTANDWCRGGDGMMKSGLLAALIGGYESHTPLLRQEKTYWPQVLKSAALRFWISRLVSRYLPGYQSESAHGDKTKDPDEMYRILLQPDCHLG